MLAASNILAGLFLPESGPSQNANDIAELYFLIMVMALVVFAGVEGTLIWILFASRLAAAASPRRSTATRGWRSGGPLAPR